ncbi:4Fe-4S binding protein [Methanobacterium ferruginis]|uniref:4Fe-4S binding protein n=1 Tax=Methanobacterium ferruginis TaxID=710191 RepID=UPI0025722CC3|nr:4Fe-4S dicluster domain-containing protein [Methanobacterium ferruginis]BDZ69110.1 hypothetical protein GCM10025860_25580 [Methanobacterium ferruginis]
MPKIEIDPDFVHQVRNLCYQLPMGIFNQEDDDLIPTVENKENCILCGRCVDNCPEDGVEHENFKN